jgi:two-component system nitrogen regulation sensor histidine kinase NtrY
VDIRSGSDEINSLIESFNVMTTNLSKSENEVHAANDSLKLTLKNLDEHNRYIEVVLRNVSAGVISVDKDGLVTTINKRAGELLKISTDKYVGRPVRELLTLEYFRTFSQLLKTMGDHKIESIQKELKVNVQGESVPLQMTLSILKNEKGDDIGKILVFDDMSAIVNAQRAAAWTEVARRIAHEIKNPLTPIRLSAERLQRKFGVSISDPAFQECTSMIIKQTEDLKTLVNEFSQFARLPQAKPVVGSINATVNESIAIFRSSHVDVQFVFEPDESVPEFKFDPDQIKRVLVNLLDNAVSAVSLEPVKTVFVATKYDPELHILRLTVADTGVGIPPQMRARVFEPYFSTKSEGTGLGLAIVKRIIEDHSGFIRALGNDPKGTKMVIELPVNEVDAWKPTDRSDKKES